MNQTLRQKVAERAGGRCEYCRVPESLDPLPFEADHIRPRKHSGRTTLSNLAWACFACNHRKGPNAAGIDQLTGKLTRLFHPRRDKWDSHFSWNGPRLVGKSAIGRTTIDVLAINLRHRVSLRKDLMAEGQLVD